MPRSTTAFVPPNLSIGAATTLPPVSLDRAPIISTPIAASPNSAANSAAFNSASSNRFAPNRLVPIAASSASLPGDSTAGAELPDGLEPRTQSRAWQYIVLHHTATDAGDIETIDEAHRKRTDSSGRPWLGIGYHFLIGNGHPMPDGLVEPTFRWHDQLHGAHAASREHNERGIGICLVGDFTQKPPTQRQVEATRRLVHSLVERYGIEAKNVLRHSDVTETECPGPLFPFETIVGHPPASRPASSPAASSPRTARHGSIPVRAFEPVH
jgi:hypothetical protein